MSQGLDELLAYTDRLAVLHFGGLSASDPTDQGSAEQIGLLMGGALAMAGDHLGPEPAAS